MREEFIPIILCMYPLLIVLLFWTARKKGKTEAWALLAIFPPIGIIALVMLWTNPDHVWGKVIRGTFWVLLAVILFSIISCISSLNNSEIDEKTMQYIKEGRQHMEDAEKAEHYRKPEVGDYVCPHCRYVFGKFIPRKDPTFIMPETTTTCPGCGKKLNNEFKR